MVAKEDRIPFQLIPLCKMATPTVVDYLNLTAYKTSSHGKKGKKRSTFNILLFYFLNSFPAAVDF